MKAPSRINKCINTINKLEKNLEYYSNGNLEQKKAIKELKDNLVFLSVEKKKDRIRHAKKVIDRANKFGKLTLKKRIFIAFRFIFTGRLL